LRDATVYISALPKAEQDDAQWQTAAELLLLIAEHGGERRHEVAVIEQSASPISMPCTRATTITR
jgi:hypothetical protein